jgi:hypothetical protein
LSWYQQLKPILLEFFHLSKDAIHIHIGFLCLVVFLLVSKRKLGTWPILIPGLSLSILMEILDLRDAYVYAGTLNFSASLHDLINTNIIPLVLVILEKRKNLKG